MLKSISCFWLFVLLPLATLTAQRLDLKLYESGTNGLTAGIGHIHQDSVGWLWFTRNSNVIKYDGDQFHSFPLAADTELEFAARIFDVNGKPWIFATPYPLMIENDSIVKLPVTNNRLDIMDHVKHKNVNYFLGEKGLSILENNKLKPLIQDDSLWINHSENLYVLNDSVLISYDFEHSILFFNIRQKKYYKSAKNILTAYKLPHKNMVISVKGEGIYSIRDLIFDIDTVHLFFDTLYAAKNDGYENLVMDASGNVWATSQYKHLLKLDEKGNAIKYDIKDGLPNLWFNHLYVDREQNVWIAFNGGIGRVFNTGMERYSSSENLYFDHINKLRAFNGGDNVFAFTPKGVNLYNGKQFLKLTYKQQPFLSADMIPIDDHFIAIQDTLLYKVYLNLQTGLVTRLEKMASLPSLLVSLEKDARGTVFIATISGLYVYENNSVSKLLDVKEYYRAMYIDKYQRLWLGEFSFGLMLYQIEYNSNKTTLRRIPLNGLEEQTPRLQKIRAICGDDHGNVLVGTRFNGLFFVEMDVNKVEKIKHFGTWNGLKSNSIWDVSIENPNKWWVCTDASIETITKLEEEYFIRDESKIHFIGKPYTISMMNQNRVMVSSFPGLAIINTSYSIDKPAFSVFITGFNLPDSVFSTEKMGQGKIRLNHQQNNIRISFTANSFVNENAIQYSYQIGNESAEWSPYSNTHTVNFSSMKPGDYRFRVKAMDATGVLSSNIAEVNFVILAPFWQEAWFAALVILAIAGFFYLLYRLRLRQITRLQNMRNSISNNLHDDIGASLSHINILTEMAKRNLESPEKAEAYLSKSSDDIQRISESLSDIVWNINPRYDNLNFLFIRMKRYAADILEAAGIEAVLVFPDEAHGEYSNMDVRHDFYMIFKEALNNLVKYSRASKAMVNVAFDKQYLVLEIKDNGVGFQVQTDMEGNGLKNMQQRAAKHRAEFSVNSSPGSGTEIKLKIRFT